MHTEALHTKKLYTEKLLHTEAFTHRSFYTQKLLHTKAFTQRKLLHTKACTLTQSFRTVRQTLHREDRNCSSEAGSRRQSQKKSILKHLRGNFKRKIDTAKFEKISWQITIAAFMQPFQHNLQCPAAKHHARQATLTQPLQSDLRSLLYKSHYNCIDQGSNPQHGCSHYTAICTLELYFIMEDASERAPDLSHKQGSQHRRREPLCARKQTVSFDS